MEKEQTKQVSVLKAHVALNVRNVTESIEFYRKMLGIEPSKVRTGYAKFNVENPPLNLTLNQAAFGERGALSHMGLQVGSTEDVLAVRERWHERGLLTRDEMQTNCCYAMQDKSWVHDPDGNEWEVFVVLEDNLAETGACCTSAAAVGQEAAVASCSTEDASSAEASSNCCAPSAIEPVALTR
ncbi:MAG TPA: ArsI/CadI family heavy metal resistance metalloenzyme [Pyrinomonadaceae bacterium]|nr:ArsI/CadI family heavy metal resistance metalloenzyme [Pyrinomonadaceae bacterium]